jgi:geranylgeranyl diphosphate synthase, type II
MAKPLTSALVPQMLQEYGAVTRAAMKNYLPAREPRRYLYDLLGDYPQRAGKMMRSSLCIATARVFGAPLEAAIHSAVAIEILHNAFLIHDDIQDESEQRRGRPTLHMLHGVPLAINAGDTMTLMSLRPLMENRSIIGESLSARVLEETERMALQSAEGQAIEIGWRRDNILDLDDTDYLELVLKKTCWLATIHPSRVGALIGAGGDLDLESFVRFGFFLGSAFQIQDDLLNLVADPRSYGKEIDGDIFEGKRTLMLIRLFREATAAERARISALFARPRAQRTRAEAHYVRALMDKYSCVDYARAIAHGLVGAAHHEYSLLYDKLPSSRDKEFIRDLVTWVIERTA